MSESRKWPEWLLRIFTCMRTPAKEPLKILDFSHGLHTEVPDEVYVHERTLEELYLNCNHLTDLPRQLFSCDELRILDVHDNNICMLPPLISHLHNLETLDLRNNNFQELPENLKNNKQLRSLGLNNNPLYKIPDVFQNLTGLAELYLNETTLEYIPAHIGKLTHLRILELRDNVLQDLPKTMHYLTKLERIDIGNNELHIFPEEICELFNLTELLLDQNHIENMPAGVGELVNLRHFDISCNNLVSLHQNIGYWTNLTELIASQNNIEALPVTIGNLKSLQMLKLDSNQIKTIPTSIGSLVELEELIITFNFVDVLPERIGLLRKLKIIHLDTNFLTSLPTELGSCTELTILSLRNNRLTRLPEELSNLKKLRVINVVDNNLTYLPLAIGKMNLGAIWLNTNQAQPLVPLLPEDLGHEVVLNSVYLPQTNSRDMSAMVREREYQKRTAKHLCFSDHDKMAEGLEPTSRLSRSPTPFPKDLRKHARPLVRPQAREEESVLLPSPSIHRAEEYRAVSTQGSEAIRRISPDPIADARPSTSTATTNVYGSSVLFFMSPKVVRKTVSFVTDSISIPHLPLTAEEDTDGQCQDDEASSIVTDPEGAQAVLAQESSPLIREARNIRTDYRSPQPSEQGSQTLIDERTTLSSKKKHKSTRIAEALAVDPRALKRVVPKLDLRIHSSEESSHRQASEPVNYGSGQSDVTVPTTPPSDDRFVRTYTHGSQQSSSVLSPINPDSYISKGSVISGRGESGTLEYIRTTSTDHSDPPALSADNRSIGDGTHCTLPLSSRTRDIEFSEDGQVSYNNGSRSSRTIPSPQSEDRFGETPRSHAGISGRTEETAPTPGSERSIAQGQKSFREDSNSARSAPPEDDVMGYPSSRSARTMSPPTDGRSAKSARKSFGSIAEVNERNRSMNGRRTAPLYDDLRSSRSNYSGRMSQTPPSATSTAQRSTNSGGPRSTAEQPRRPVNFNQNGESSERSLGTRVPSERRAVERETFRRGPHGTQGTHFETEAAIVNGSTQRSMSDAESLKSDYSVQPGSLPRSTGDYTPARSEIRSPMQNGNSHRSMSDAQSLKTDSGSKSGTPHSSLPGDTLHIQPWTETEAPRSTSDIESFKSGSELSRPSLPGDTMHVHPWARRHPSLTESETQTLSGDSQRSLSELESLRTPKSDSSIIRQSTTHTPLHEEISQRSIREVESFRSDARVDVLPESSIINVQSRPPTPGNLDSPRVDLTKRITPASDPGFRLGSRPQGTNMESLRSGPRSEPDGRKTNVKPRAPLPPNQPTVSTEKNIIDLETLRQALGSVLGGQHPQRSLAEYPKKKDTDSEESLLDADSFHTDSGSRWDSVNKSYNPQYKGSDTTPPYSSLPTGDNSARTISQEDNRTSRHSSHDYSFGSGDTTSPHRSTKSSHHSQKKPAIDSPHSEEPLNGGSSKPQPPPYHIAKHYSTQAQYFEQEPPSDNRPGSPARNEEEVARIAGFDRPCRSSIGEGSIPESPHIDEPTPHMFSERPAPGEHLVVPKPHRLSEAASLGSQSPFGGHSSHSSHRQQEVEFSQSMHSSPRTDSYMELPSNLVDILEPRSSAFGTSMQIPPYSGSSDISQRSDLASHGAIKKTEDPRRVKTADGRLGGNSHRSNKVSPTSRTPSKWMFGKHKNATVIDIILDKPDDIGFEVSENNGDGIYVENVFLESASMLQIGDKILAIEGQDVSSMTKEEVMLLLRNAGSQISVMVSKMV